MKIEQDLIEHILEGVFNRHGRIKQGDSNLGFVELAGIIWDGLDECIHTYERMDAINIEIAELENRLSDLGVDKKRLMEGCSHASKRILRNDGVETIYCGICREVFDNGRG